MWIAEPGWLGVDELSLVGKIGLAVSIGCIGGIGINTAHELGHKKESHERWLSKIALAQSFYGHFYIEHNRGHHVRVATPGGPGPQPLRRELLPVLAAHGGRLAEERLAPGEEALRPQGQAPVPDRQRRPQRVADVGGALGRADRRPRLGDPAVPGDPGDRRLLAARGRELHGALRDAAPEGRRRASGSATSASTPSHSWNSNNIATNVLLYHLQRHSDHHANPTRRYQTLRDYEESPVLPTGYAGMIVLAIFPPIWRRVMDPRVVAHFDGDLTLANIHPGKRDRILRKHGLDEASPAQSRHASTTRQRPRQTRRARSSPPGAPGAATPTTSRAVTSTRASPQAPPGPTSPTAGAAPTAASARRSTSSPWTRRWPRSWPPVPGRGSAHEDPGRPRQV